MKKEKKRGAGRDEVAWGNTGVTAAAHMRLVHRRRHSASRENSTQGYDDGAPF